MSTPKLMTPLAAAAYCVAALLFAPPCSAAPRHFAANGNFDAGGGFVPGAYGFDLADVGDAESLDLLPDGVLGLVWLGACDGADARFRLAVAAVIDHPKLFGFYLIDDPDPSGVWRRRCPAENLRAESDWIHARRSGAATFIALMNVGDAANPAFDATLRPENSHVDLFGVAPYPCRRDWRDCDVAMVGRFAEAARRAGVPDGAVVPVYQTFGGGEWRAEGGGYRPPEPAEMERIIAEWRRFAPAPAFDFAYSWGSQRADAALSMSAGLQGVFKRHNAD
jgi:hypothetical protein